MSAISYIAEIPRYNVSSLTCVDLSGNITDLTGSTLQGIDLLTISSFTASYTTGYTNVYVPNMPTLEERSTLMAVQANFDTSTSRNLSTSMGVLELPITPDEKISTLVGLSTNNFLVTMDDLLEITNTYKTIENTNKLTLQTLDYDILKKNLFTWATKGFPDSFPVHQLPITLPPEATQLINCSDGVMRNIWDYIVFFLGTTLQELMDSYHTNVDGIRLTYSVQANPYIVVLHATRS